MTRTPLRITRRHRTAFVRFACCHGLAFLIGTHAAILDPRTEGSETVVLYNSRLPESRELADYYAARRGVPANHLIGLDLPLDESISRRKYQEQLHRPLLRALEHQGLIRIGRDSSSATSTRSDDSPTAQVVEARIRYLTLCYGLPLRILPEPGLVEAGRANLPEQLRRNEAAVDSELALLPASVRGLPLTGPIVNPVYGWTNAARLHPTNGVLLVGRLDGPSVDIARALVDRAISAETNGLWGRAYFDLRGSTNQSLQLGERWLGLAADIVRRMGYETVVDTRPETFPVEFPMSHIAWYGGWYDEHVSGPFTRSKVEFMPGAVAYHLHSFSAASIRSTNRHWVGPLLARGATASMGTVFEPYLELTPNLALFWSLLIEFALSFGEAATAAQPVLSWQTAVVGDPLYRPFGRIEPGGHVGNRFMALHGELARRQSPKLAWSILQVINFRLEQGESPVSIIAEIQGDTLVQQSSILQEKLAQLLVESGEPSKAIAAYEQALNLETSPQQSTRLTLAMAGLLATHSREQEALDLYEAFLREVPEYPAPANIYRKMLPLARHLDQPDTVQRIQAAIDRLSTSPPVGVR